MSWNYRVMRHKDKTGKGWPDFLQIHKVHYRNGKICGWSEDGAIIGGDSIEGIQQVLDWIKECLAKPILDFDMKPEISWSEPEEEII